MRFPARFDPDAWEADLARSTPAGRVAAENARREYSKRGVPREHLRPCDPEGRDGTGLPHCLKVYVPPPAGRFGMVLKLVHADRQLRLEFLAFGVRHHPKGSHAPSVYEIAHARLLDSTARDREQPSEIQIGVADGMPIECVLVVANTFSAEKVSLTKHMTTLDAVRMSEVWRMLAWSSGC